MGYLRGITQAYTDGYVKSMKDHARDSAIITSSSLQIDEHERYAMQAADFMLKHPHRAAKNGLNASLLAEIIAVRGNFYLLSLSLSLHLFLISHHNHNS